MAEISRMLPSWTHLLIVPGLLIGFTVHELGHALVAYGLGDVTPVKEGRITFNPLRHMFWLGFLTFFFLGFGWARPVRMEPDSFKKPYLGVLLVSLSGAAANLVMVIVSLITTVGMAFVVGTASQHSPAEVLRYLTVEPSAQPAIIAWTAAFTSYVLYVNLALAFFNLLPLPGLDGFSVIVSIVGLVRNSPTDDARAPSLETRRREPFPPSPPAPELTNNQNPAPVDVPSPMEGPISNGVTGNDPGRRQPADIHFQHGASYHAEGNYEGAIARYRQTIAHNERYGPAYVNMGLAYLAQGKEKRASHAFRGALQFATDPESRQQAWEQLNKMAELNQPVTESEETTGEIKSGDSQGQTEVKPVPDWRSFWLTGTLLLFATAGVYIFLVAGMVQHFA